MKIPSVWLMVILTWFLVLISYFFSGIDWILITFLLLTFLAFSAVSDWLISDSKKPKKKKIH